MHLGLSIPSRRSLALATRLEGGHLENLALELLAYQGLQPLLALQVCLHLPVLLVNPLRWVLLQMHSLQPVQPLGNLLHLEVEEPSDSHQH